MESKGTTVVASFIHKGFTDSYRYTTLADTDNRECGTRTTRNDPLADWSQSDCVPSLRSVFRAGSRPAPRSGDSVMTL